MIQIDNAVLQTKSQSFSHSDLSMRWSAVLGTPNPVELSYVDLVEFWGDLAVH